MGEGPERSRIWGQSDQAALSPLARASHSSRPPEATRERASPGRMAQQGQCPGALSSSERDGVKAAEGWGGGEGVKLRIICTNSLENVKPSTLHPEKGTCT